MRTQPFCGAHDPLHAQVPPKVEYRLTALGQALAPVFLALLDWADLRAAERKAEALAS
jgi:DNA-binding HxlR family transcriptional regulator